MTAWLVSSLPIWVGKYTFLEMVPGNRALVGTGVGSIIFTIIFLSDYYEKKKIKNNNHSLFVLYILVFLGMVLFGFKLNMDISNLFSVNKIILVSVLFSLLICFIFKRKTLYFFILLLPIIIIPGFPINSINRGVEDIKDRPLVEVVNGMNMKKNNSIWVVFGSHWQASVLQSSGANIINGVKYVPELTKMKVLDSSDDFLFIYNRYSHIEFDPITSLNEIKFILNQADFYTVNINPCNDRLKQLSIDYLILPNNVKYNTLKCLKKLNEEAIEQMNIFEYKK